MLETLVETIVEAILKAICFFLGMVIRVDNSECEMLLSFIYLLVGIPETTVIRVAVNDGWFRSETGGAVRRPRGSWRPPSF